MTKKDLIDQVAARFPRFAHKDIEIMINAVFDSLVEAMLGGKRIEIRGFGSFVVKQRRAREGRNPKTGTLVSVPPKCIPFFKVGKDLRLKVDQQKSPSGTKAG